MGAWMAIAFVLVLLAPAALRGQEPSEIVAMAVYRSTETFQGDIPLDRIEFHVTDRDTIRRVLETVAFADPRNGSRLKAKANAFVYLRDEEGAVAAYEVYLAWQYFAHAGRRERSYPIDPEGGALLESLAR